MKKQLIFVSGVARSGTSALVSVLNRHPDFFIGMERFFFLISRGLLTSDHFVMERFVDVKDGDTHGKGFGENMDQRISKYHRAKFIGDKYPLLYQNFDSFLLRFPEAKHIYIVRNPVSVMESYDARFRDEKDNWNHSAEKGLLQWNESVSRVTNLSVDELNRFYFVEYEDFFSSEDNINSLFHEIGVGALEKEKLTPFVDKFNSLNAQLVSRRDDIRRFAVINADWGSYKKLLELIEVRRASS